MDLPSLHPPLPPKNPRRLPAVPPPSLAGSQPELIRTSSERLSRSVPSQSPHSPASFLNPFYYHVNVAEQARKERSASLGEASLHYIGSKKVPVNPVVKFSDSDSDSVYSLESLSSHSAKSDRYVDGPFVRMKQDSPDHVYELCEVERPREKLKDIFDLVSFKSPLYGSILKDRTVEPLTKTPADTYDVPESLSETYNIAETSSEIYDVPDSVSETYDVPLKKYLTDNISKVGVADSICSQAFGISNSECNFEVYDVPVKNSPSPSFRLNVTKGNQVPEETTLPEDMTSQTEEFSNIEDYFDGEILCDIDGMLPPPYPPPPPPIDIDIEEPKIAPKLPPRPIPPPIPKRSGVLVDISAANISSDNTPSTALVKPKKTTRTSYEFISPPSLTNLSLSNAPKSQSATITPTIDSFLSELVTVSTPTSSPILPKKKIVSDRVPIVPSRGPPKTDEVLKSPNLFSSNSSSTPKSTSPVLSLKSNKSTSSRKLPKILSKVVNIEASSASTAEVQPKRGFEFPSLSRFKKFSNSFSEFSEHSSLSSLASSADLNTTDCILESNNSLEEEEYATRQGVLMCGYLYKVGNHGKDLSKKWYSLEYGHLCSYSDHKADCPQGRTSRRNIVGVSLVLPNSTGSEFSTDLWCLRIFTVNSRHMLLGARLPSERNDWVRILGSLIASPGLIPGNDASIDLQCLGQVYTKEGVAGKWQKGCLALCGRWLHLWLEDTEIFRRINLQTVATIARESSMIQCISAVERGPVFHLNLLQGVLYIQGDWTLYTETLLQALTKGWGLPPNAGLADHYITNDGIPLIVDKCLKFISTHGTQLEGIYRLSGSSSKIRQLLECFVQDVWSVHLKLEDYSPHDVTSVLKRFLRNLPECLLTEKLYTLWVEGSAIHSKLDRLQQMKDLLSHLPEINYNTLKKLIGHLCMITEHSSLNLMPALNLAPVFGPTLLFMASGEAEGLQMTTSATDVVADLIRYYTTLFEVEDKELEKERTIQLAVQRMKDSMIVQKPAGDILVGIYIYSKDWGKCINVRITPTMTAHQICEYAVSVGNIREPLSKISLMEMVCDGNLERPVHYSEFVLQVTMRWIGLEEAKDNYLLIKHNSVYDAILPVVNALQGQAMSVFGELNYADTNAKSFKKLHFEFTSAKLKCYKMVKTSQQLVGEWNIEDISWYIGAESKRPPATKWAFTFVDRKVSVKRSKSNPFFGRTVCCRSEEELHKWVAAMLIGEYPQGLLPVISLPDLLI